ncbi:MAG TPA: TIGR03960 family radical SAM protein, partial [Lachnospiraceae bacterium]|nr:TIGR03960 family radical SAM protein [Lachnospiraceae bacterium]
SSLSSSDYSKLPELVNFLIEECKKRQINISLPSLRIDAFSLDVMNKVQDVRKSSLTFAPEAGSQRMRDVINKGLTEEVILEGASLAFQGGWNKVKLYFMLGLPGETEEDRKDIAHLADKIARCYYEIPKEQRNGKCQITASTSFFIPKPFTPFQWAAMFDPADYLNFAYTVNHEIKAQLNHKSLRYSWHEADVTVLEGVFARGDRKLSAVLLKAYELGCIYDSWNETFRNDLWMQAFEETGISIEFYTKRQRDLDEIFPWDFIDAGVTKEFLKREWKRAMEGVVTPNCRMQCQGCGAMKYGGGVCFEG